LPHPTIQKRKSKREPFIPQRRNPTLPKKIPKHLKVCNTRDHSRHSTYLYTTLIWTIDLQVMSVRTVKTEQSRTLPCFQKQMANLVSNF
jgi:hypothetical protein